MGESTDEVKAGDDASDSSAQSEEQSSDVTELKRNIEDTREDLSQTIDALQERLNPANIKQQVTDATIGKAEELVHTAGEKIQAVAGPAADKAQVATSVVKEKSAPLVRLIKRFPLPSVLAALAIIWLLSRWLAGRSADAVPVEISDLDDLDF